MYDLIKIYINMSFISKFRGATQKRKGDERPKTA